MADNFRGLTTGATLGRELPFSQEAEEAVLGGVLRDPSVLPKVIEILKPESFYRPQHQQLFTIIVRMFTTGSKEDLITVINEAVTMGVFETSAMAKNYLLGIMEMVPSTDNIESYCKIIEEKARVRSLINAANQILEKAYDGVEDSQTQLDAAVSNFRNGEQILNQLGQPLCIVMNVRKNLFPCLLIQHVIAVQQCVGIAGNRGQRCPEIMRN